MVNLQEQRNWRRDADARLLGEIMRHIGDIESKEASVTVNRREGLVIVHCDGGKSFKFLVFDGVISIEGLGKTYRFSEVDKARALRVIDQIRLELMFRR